MTPFDTKAFMAEVVANEQAAANDTSVWDKLQGNGAAKANEVAAAAQRKLDELQAKEERRKQTWAGQMGIEQESFTGGAVNQAAGITAATVEAVGDIGGAGLGLNAMGHEEGVPQDAKQAYARWQNDEATPEDVELLQTGTENDRYYDRMEKAGSMREKIGAVDEATDWRSIVDTTDRDRLSEELRDGAASGMDSLKAAGTDYGAGDYTGAVQNAAVGIADLVLNGGSALLSNPQATAEYITEMAPDLLLGSVSKPLLVARNIGYGLNTYNKGLENYAADNNGQAPTEGERRWMLTNGIAMGLMESVADNKLLKSIKPPKAATEGAKGSVARTAKEGGKGLLTEGVTEGVQTAMEGEASYRSASALDVYEGAVIGAGVGGAISTGGRAVAEASGSTEEQGQIRKTERVAERSVDEKIVDAVSKDSFDSLTSKEGRKAFPVERVAVALHGAAKSEKSTPEQKQASTKALAKLESDITQEIEAAKMDAPAFSKDSQDELKDELRRTDAFLNVLKKEGATDDIAGVQEIRDGLAEKLKAGRKQDSTERKALDLRLKTMNQELEQVTSLRSQLNSGSGSAAVATKAMDTTLAPEERNAAAQEAVTLAMQGGELDPVQAKQLADDAALVLSEDQRSYLRQLSDAAVARNAVATSDSTHQDIFSGKARDGFKSLPQYQSAVASALQSGNVAAAETQLEGLRAFARGHKAKAELAKQAAEQSQATGRQMAIWSDPRAEGGWSLRPFAGKTSDTALRKNGGLSFSKGTGSQKLAKDIALEYQAIEATAKELAAAVKMNQVEQQPAANDSVPVTEQPEAVSTPEPTVEAGTEQGTVEQVSEATTEPTTQPVVEAEAVEPDADAMADRFGNEEVATETSPEPLTEEATPEPEQPVQAEGEAETTANPYGVTFEPVTGALSSEDFFKKNLFGAYFHLKKSKDDGRSKHPLATKENFFTEVLVPAIQEGSIQPAALQPYVKEMQARDPETGTSAQIRYLREMSRYIWKSNKLTQKNFKHKTGTSAAYRHEDFIQFLADETGQLPENIKTAIAVAEFTWIQENGGESAYNKDAVIRNLLGESSSYTVQDADRALVGTVNTVSNNVVNDLGRRVSDAAGIQLNNDAPTNHEAQLITSLGNAALKNLMDRGFAERMGRKHERLPGGGKEITWFIRVKRDWTGKYPVNSAEVEKILEVSTGVQSIGQKLFGVEHKETGPSFEPITTKQTTTSGTDQGVPSEQQAIVQNEMQNKTWGVRTDIKQFVDVLQALMPDQARSMLYTLVGVVDTNKRVIQKTREASVKGKNDGLIRDVDNLLDFYQNPGFRSEDGSMDYSRTFTFPLDIWVNQRVGIASKTVNPLNSKAHRSAVAMTGWEHQVPVKGNGKGVTKADKHKLKHFKLAVLEGLGYPVDKETNTRALNKGWNKAVNAPETQKHIQTVEKLIAGTADVTQAEVESLMTFSATKENFHTLDTLIHLARWKMAGDTGTFTSTLTREGDGITNGPAFALIMSGAWGSLEDGFNLVNKMGLFEKGNKHQSAGAWQEDPANNDLYQTNADTTGRQARAAYANASDGLKAKYRAVSGLIGSFHTFDGDGQPSDQVSPNGRKQVKLPVTSMMFGAGTNRSIKSMGAELEGIFFERVEDVLNDVNLDDSGKQNQLNALTKLINAFLGHKLPPIQLQHAQGLVLGKQQKEDLVNGFVTTVGKHVKQSLEEEFDSPKGDKDRYSFIQHRQKMNKVAKQAFHMYSLTRDYEIRQFLSELDLPVNKDGEPLQYLTKAQLTEVDARLKAINPLVHTAMSKASGERDAGLHIAKPKSRIKAEAAFRSSSAFTSSFTSLHPSKGDGDPSTTLHSYGRSMGISEPGVRTFITNIHALDSAIASRTYTDFPALNVHDAEIVAAYMMETVAEQMNQKTFEALVDFSLPEEIMKMGFRTYDGFEVRRETMEKDPEFKVGFAKAFPKDWRSKDYEQVIIDLVDGLKSANIAEANKLALLAEIETVNQYGVEGGEYKLIEADYARIAERQKTSVTDRIMKDRLRSRTEDGSVVAQNLAQWIEEATQVTVQKDARPAWASLNDLRKINDAFITTGELDTAVDQVIKSPKARQQWNGWLFDKLAGDQGSKRDVRNSSLSHVLNLMEDLDGIDTVPADLAKSMETLREYVRTETDLFDKPLSVLMQDALGESEQVEALTGFLNRVHNSTRNTPWGLLGRSTIASDMTLVQALEAKPVMPVKDLLKLLPRTKLTRALYSLADPGLKVRYITANTPADLMPQENITRARGFWTNQSDSEYIGIKSPEYVDSNVSPELVTHEVLHSVLYQTVVDVQKGVNKDTGARAMVRELGVLRARAVEYLNENDLMDTYGNAVQNTHELIAWGMTNKDFQDNVLAKIEMKSKNTGRLSSALKDFVNSIAKFLFGSQAGKVRDNGVGVLLVNTAGLMEQTAQRQAQQVKAQANTTTLKQEAGPSPQAINQWTTQEIYQAIEGDRPLDAATDQRLQGLLSTVVEKIHGPYGTGKTVEGMVTADDVYRHAKATGQMPFASQTRAHFALTDQQAFVLEQIEASLRAAMAGDSLAYKELVRSFRDARNKLKPADFFEGDWATATVGEKAHATEKHQYLFDIQSKSGTDRTDHLSRFAALALVEPTLFNKLNGMVDGVQAPTTNKMGDQLKHWFDRTVQQLSNQINNTPIGQGANNRLVNLSQRLADIEGSRRRNMARDKSNVLDQVEAAGSKLGQAVRGQISTIAESDGIANSKSGYVQALGAMASTAADDRVGELLDALEQYRAHQFGKRQGLIGSLFSEMRGATEQNQFAHKLLRMTGQNERERKHLNESVKKDIKERFQRELSRKDSEALTRVVLRTDMSALLPEFGMEGISRLLSDPRSLQKAISVLENRINGLGHASHYKAYSKLLGHFMATGKARGPHMSMNAYNIARLAGTGDSITAAQAKQAEKLIDPLVSLYALQYTSRGSINRVAEILREETPRGNESGVLYTIKLHEKFKEEALNTLFDGDPVLFMKGYTREIYNPHREIRVVDEKAGKELEAKGWIKQERAVQHDRADTDQDPKFVYLLPHGGLQAQVTGSMSYTGTRRKGTAVHSGEFVPTEQTVHQKNQETNQTIAAQSAGKVKAFGRLGNTIEPEHIKENFLVPVYNPQGKAVNYRYLMSETNKDELLERNNQLEEIMGSMASHMFDKNSSAQQNKLVVQSMKDHYDIESVSRPKSFIKVGPKSEDAQARETYHMLPDSTKRAIREVWGGDDMWVQADMIDMVFGYRKFSVSNMFDKPSVHRNTVERVMVDILESTILKPIMGGEKAGLRVRRFEDAWQEVVKEIKDAWVIKNLTTLMGNISSNVSILLWNGMSPKKIIETHKTAINGLLQYQEEHNALTNLEREQSLGLSGNPKALEQQIRELRDSMDRNPVKDLIDEGLFQTILEDVDAESSDYSFKSRLVGKLEKTTENVPEAIKKGAKLAYMAHDTSLYKLLFKSTQMSDFVARYSLHQHLTTRAKDPMSHDAAVQRIADTFVNYDVPTHRTLQYLNDTGLVFFTKYYLRIQKVMMQLFQEKPARGLLLALFSNYLSDIPTIMESGPRISNPLDSGALNFGDAMTEILPIKAGLSVW